MIFFFSRYCSFKKIFSLFGLFIFSVCSFASAEPHDLKAPIKIGMSTVLSGPSEKLGEEMKLGVEVYFNKINAAGGIEGRKLQLIALDDRYEPALAAPNMRQLIDKDQVLAVIGNVGTATTIVARQIADEKHILLFAPFTGARILRKAPPDRYIIHFRASYEHEIENMIKGLLSSGFKPQELAFFIQNDHSGDSGYKEAMLALKQSGYQHPENLPFVRYDPERENIESGLSKILSQARNPIKAFILVSTYKPSAAFIKAAKKEFPRALFVNASVVGSEALADELNTNEEGIIVTEVVPPLNSNLPAVNEYIKDMKMYAQGITPDVGSLEGYLVAKLFVMGLKKAATENKLSREGIIDTFESMRQIDIGLGIPINFDVTDHQGMKTVWPVILKNGTFIPLDWQELKVTNQKNR